MHRRITRGKLERNVVLTAPAGVWVRKEEIELIMNETFKKEIVLADTQNAVIKHKKSQKRVESIF